MSPAATLVHHMPGRTRVRVPIKRGDSEYFAKLREHLAQCPGVTWVTTSALTGSVLVAHEAADPDVLVAYARTFELFELLESSDGFAGQPRSPAAMINGGARRLDEWIRTQTTGGTDLRSLALTGLIGAALWQLLRGQALPAATTLVWYALTVAVRYDFYTDVV
jgi:hypothetical protein